MTTSDASGRFSFISLAPDTYAVSVPATATYQSFSASGVTVQADQSITVTLTAPRVLQKIGSVTSRAASSLVKPGTTVDVYSINATTQDKAAALSGGGLLTSAWSAITAVPGVYVAPGSNSYVGAGSTISIRGGDYDQIGYELDGVPVNRSYDNYPSSHLSALGQQELQVYTGAAPSNSEGQGISGYINQVIRTGTAPAYKSLDLATGAPAYYGRIAFETGGANPSRTFSYYAGFGAYNEDFRAFDQFNGTALSRNYGPPLSNCQNNAAAKGAAGYYTDPATAPSCYSSTGLDYTNGGATAAYVLAPMNFGQVARDLERDNVVNLHFGIPRRDGNKDDVQFLWDSSTLRSTFYNSTNDLGGVGYANAIGIGTPSYPDQFSYLGAPLGATVPIGSIGNGIVPALYPYSPGGRALGAAIAPNLRDDLNVDQGIIKLQYQHNFGTSAYLRVYGYTFYSDWLENGANSATYYNFAGGGVVDPLDYNVSSHTRGLSVQFSDQLNAQHLFTVQGNYSTASVYRDNATNRWLGAGEGNYAALVDPNNLSSGQCYSYQGGLAAVAANCYSGTGFNTQTAKKPTGATFVGLGAAAGGAFPAVPAGTMCGTSVCQYLIINNGSASSYNNATPKFSALSLNDNWKPTDKLTVDVGIRYDSYQFIGANTYNSPARQFLFAAYNSQAPAKGLPTLFNPNASTSEQFQVWQPRAAFTFAVNPTTVLRASYGRYGQPPLDAFEQYDYLQPNAVGGLVNFARGGLGNTFLHRIVPPVSNNYDFSFEKQFGRDLSLKLTPFLRQTQNQIEDFILDQKTNFVSGVNVGNQRSQGFELEVDKGDFARDGLAARLSFGYTNSYIRYSRFNGVSVADAINASISNYNGFTKAGGGAPCYTTGGAPDPACAAGSIANPYYNTAKQSLLDPNGNYAPFSTFPVGNPAGAGYSAYGAPYVGTLIAQYKRHGFAITPALQFVGGQRYGVPITTPGIDPTTCAAGLAGSTAGDTRYPGGAAGGVPYDSTSCTATIAIPNPQTGNFDQIGQFVQPSSLILHLQASYDVSKRLTLVANFANVAAKCFGGSQVKWAVPGACSYGIPLFGTGATPIGNLYNPGFAIQPAGSYSYGPASFGAAPPFNAFLEARLKL